MINYTVVLGVDAPHVEKLALVIQSWAKHKPSLFDQPWVIFIDDGKVSDDEIRTAVGSIKRPKYLTVRYWPDEGVNYDGDPNNKWFNPQRYKMLAGFVHVPPLLVQTKYWLKIDLDVIATGQDDWVQEAWFDNHPAIVAPGWGYTKPPTQIDELDAWVENNKEHLLLLGTQPPLNIHPEPGASMVRHKRIASWCAFFETEFTRICAKMAERTCGRGHLPVRSQDGFMWYCAARLGLPIAKPPMKMFGWECRNSMASIREAVGRACG